MKACSAVLPSRALTAGERIGVAHPRRPRILPILLSAHQHSSSYKFNCLVSSSPSGAIFARRVCSQQPFGRGCWVGAAVSPAGGGHTDESYPVQGNYVSGQGDAELHSSTSASHQQPSDTSAGDEGSREGVEQLPSSLQAAAAGREAEAGEAGVGSSSRNVTAQSAAGDSRADPHRPGGPDLSRLDPQNAASVAEALALLNADVVEEVGALEDEALMVGSGPDEADGHVSPCLVGVPQAKFWSGDVDRADRSCYKTHHEGGERGCRAHSK